MLPFMETVHYWLSGLVGLDLAWSMMCRQRGILDLCYHLGLDAQETAKDLILMWDYRDQEVES